MNEDIKQPVFGSWYIDQEIGSGSFGTVYKIKRELFEKTQYAAMKVIRIPQDKSEKVRLMSEGMDEESITGYYNQFVQDFSKEIEVMVELQGNTNIVGYNDHDIIENEDGIGFTIYIRMEYLTPLDRFLVSSDNKVKELSQAEVIKLAIDMCTAIEVCASKNIIHRDIKPDNIFVSEKGDYKLGDFGIARQLESTQSGLSKKGTYTYMAPEIYNGQAYNSTVDIYSLGIVLYRLLNKNRTPFLPYAPAPIKYTDKEKALICRMKGEPIPSIPNINDELNRIVLKACSFDPKERYQSVTEMKMELIAISEDPTIKVAFDAEEKSQEKTYTDDLIDVIFHEKEMDIDKDDLNNEKTVGPFDNFKEENGESDNTVDKDDLNNEKTVGPFGNFKEENGESDNTVDKDDLNDDKTVGPFADKKMKSEKNEVEKGDLDKDKPLDGVSDIKEKESKDSRKGGKKKGVIIALVLAIVVIIVGVVIAFSSSGSNNGISNDVPIDEPSFDNTVEDTEIVSEFTAYDVYVSREGGLSVRTGPGKDYDKIIKLDLNQAITVVDDCGEWLLVQYNDVEGYVEAKYVSDEKSTTKQATKTQTTKKQTTKKQTTKKQTADDEYYDDEYYDDEYYDDEYYDDEYYDDEYYDDESYDDEDYDGFEDIN